jgi:hypothetical protein
MHLIAVYRPVLTLCALNTSEKVPSPCREINRYFCIARHQRLRALQPFCAEPPLASTQRDHAPSPQPRARGVGPALAVPRDPSRMRGSQQPDLSSRRSLAPPPGCRGPTCGDPVTGAATALFVSSRRMSDPHSQHRGRLPLWRDVKLFGDECTAAGTLRSLRQARWRGTSKGGARGPPGARGSPSRSVGKC